MNTTGVLLSAEGSSSTQACIGPNDSSGRFSLAYGVIGSGVCARGPEVDAKHHHS